MELSQHAMIRGQQRGIPKEIVELILMLGQPNKKGGNAFEYKVRKKDASGLIGELKRLIGTLQKVTDKAALVNEDAGKIITVYHKTSLRRRDK